MQNESRKRQTPAALWRQSMILLLVLPQLHLIPGSRMPRETLSPARVAWPQAHAHNDYRHEQPLREALACGFTSVEADVHLVDGELYLGQLGSVVGCRGGPH